MCESLIECGFTFTITSTSESIFLFKMPDEVDIGVEFLERTASYTIARTSEHQTASRVRTNQDSPER